METGNFGTSELILVFITAVIFLVPFIFFLITQQNTLKSIQPQNRLMSPGEVWLQLIPLFGIIWQFIVVNRIADSIRKEIEYRSSDSVLGLPDATFVNDLGKRPTYDIGITYCILSVCTIVPILGTFAGIAALICWIIYWVKLAEYKGKLSRLVSY